MNQWANGSAFETESDGFEFTDESELPHMALETPLDEATEMELAAELLEITDEAELDQFLGNVFKKVRGGIKKIGKPLGKVLKKVAKVALPIAGTAAGISFGGPLGGMVGGKLASGASKLFGLEMEGMSGEDQEFEVARRFVRLAAGAAKNAGRMAPSGNPDRDARRAVISAARRHAPGLVRKKRPHRGPGRGPLFPPPAVAGGTLMPPLSGRWLRQGHQIIILNCPGASGATATGAPGEPAEEPDMGAAAEPAAAE